MWTLLLTNSERVINTIDLNTLYSNWSKKSPAEIAYDIEASCEKAEIAFGLLDRVDTGQIKSVLEMGSGFGKGLHTIANKSDSSCGLGVDFSQEAVEYAKKHYEGDKIKFIRTDSLDIKLTVDQIRKLYPDCFDITILFDVLEHIPKPKTFVRELAAISKFFLINLPLDNTILNNYVRSIGPGTYPSILHGDGHLREFTVNDVHKFVTSLGLTPLSFQFYQYSINNVYPNHLKPSNFKGVISNKILKAIFLATRHLVPLRAKLRLFNGGAFMCLAEWSSSLVLE